MMNADYERVEQAAQILGEHFDTVQIFVSRHEPTEGGTISITNGTGNWNARRGQVRDWVTEQDERLRCHVRGQEEA